ncbi:MAG: type II secretion system protein N [bacterium]
MNRPIPLPDRRARPSREARLAAKLRRTAFVVSAFLAGNALAVLAARSLPPSHRPFATAASRLATAARTESGATPGDPPLETIFQRNLFGAQRTVAVPPPAPPVPNAAAARRYELIGTVVGSDPRESQAILRAKGGDTEAFTVRPRQVLEGGTEVLAIERRRVLLAIDGIVQALSFELESVVDTGAAVGDASDARAPQVASDDTRGEPIAIDAATFDRVVRDPTPLASDARSAPALVGGQLGGWRVLGIRRGSLFERLGLRDGDVVQRVNSAPLTSIEATLATLNGLRSSRELEVQLLRDQRQRTLAYQVR